MLMPPSFPLPNQAMVLRIPGIFLPSFPYGTLVWNECNVNSIFLLFLGCENSSLISSKNLINVFFFFSSIALALAPFHPLRWGIPAHFGSEG